MITPADDYPIHQTSEPIAYVGTSDRNYYDRYFFNGYSRDGEVYFAAAMGFYPNRLVADAAFSVVHRGRQYVVRASRRARGDRMDTTVGPIRVEVVEPLKRLRLIVATNAHDLAAELTFSARVPPLEEPPFFRRTGERVWMNYTRLTQHGEWSGTLTVANESISLSGPTWWGSRDRSWGIRPVGERESGAPALPTQFFWLWAPLSFDDVCSHFSVSEDGDGQPWHATGMIIPVGGAPDVMRAVAHRIRYRPGTRHAQHAELVLSPRSGSDVHFTLRPLYNFYMVGLGYGHPQWGHGMYVGDDVVSGESFALSGVDPAVPLNLHVQAVCQATMGTKHGIGVLEQLIFGPHRPSGFKELFDLAAT